MSGLVDVQALRQLAIRAGEQYPARCRSIATGAHTMRCRLPIGHAGSHESSDGALSMSWPFDDPQTKLAAEDDQPLPRRLADELYRALDEIERLRGQATRARDALETARPALKWVLNHWGRTKKMLSDHDRNHAKLALDHVLEALAALRGGGGRP